jgi:hypothetical protein
VHLDLVDGGLDLGRGPDLLDPGGVEVGDADALDLALLDHGLHGLPGLGRGHINDVQQISLCIDREALLLVDLLKRNGPVNLCIVVLALTMRNKTDSGLEHV